ncbi:MAG: hypothetical protein JKX95_05575 [Bacteroidia bacterium]|nr:hypothetical protein [Bacteroidia bacterium]
MPELLEVLQFFIKVGVTIFLILLTFKFVFSNIPEKHKVVDNNSTMPDLTDNDNLNNVEVLEEPRNILLITRFVDTVILVSLDVLLINYLWLSAAIY